MIGNRAATTAYWMVAIVLSALAGVGGANWGNSLAPSFHNEDAGGTPATSASRLLFSVFGGLLGALGVLAVFAAIFMVLWLRQRRASVEEEQENDESFIDDIEFGGYESRHESDHETRHENDHEDELGDEFDTAGFDGHPDYDRAGLRDESDARG